MQKEYASFYSYQIKSQASGFYFLSPDNVQNSV